MIAIIYIMQSSLSNELTFIEEVKSVNVILFGVQLF